jgi:hypothetical protein
MRPGRGSSAVVAMCVALSMQGCFLFGDDDTVLVEGRLFDSSKAAPLASAEVKVGSHVVQTDAEGKFAVEIPAGDVIVSSKAAGHSATAKRVTPSRQGAYVELFAAPVAAVADLDAAAGGTVETARKEGITLPPDAVLKQDGSPVTGTFEAAVTPLQPKRGGDVAALPGDTLVRSAGGSTVLAEPNAMLLVSLEQAGEPLELATGAQATLKVAASADDPASAKVFAFDEESAQWTEAGVASKREEAEGPVYVTSVAKAGPIMIGKEVPAAEMSCISACIERDGAREGAARVRVEGVNHVAKFEVDVNANGCFTAVARAGKQVRVVAVAKSATTPPQVLTTPPASDTCVNLGTLQATEAAAPDCPGGFVPCGEDGTCADLQADAAHCGTCGNACDALPELVNASCIEATCACAAGFMQCLDEGSGLQACTDTGSSRQHCGACDAPCAEGQECTNGACTAIMCVDPGTVLRGNFCEPGDTHDCSTIPGCALVEERWMFAVSMADAATTGDTVCAAAGLTCAGVPVLATPSAACVAFHPEALVTSNASGWRQSVYCDGSNDGAACNFEVKCHDCPACVDTGLTCGTSSSTQLSELFVECVPQT